MNHDPDHSDIQELLEKARRAQQAIEWANQHETDRIVAAVGRELCREENARLCAESAVSETGMGRVEDKLLKHRKKTLGVLRDLYGVATVGAIETDSRRGLVKYAKPVGVVAAVLPATNPTATPACNGLAILKTRNAVVFAPHPLARKTTDLVVGMMRNGLRAVGAPLDLVQVLPRPLKERIHRLMEGADLALATGSSELVRAAYSSGTPALGVGTGNAIAVVDETADIEDAARKIAAGQMFDHGSSCSSENSIVVQKSVRDPLLAALRQCGGMLCSSEQKEALRAVLWPDGRRLSPAIVARPASRLTELTGISVTGNPEFLMVLGEMPPETDLFSREKLCPVIAIWEYDLFAEAIDLVERIMKPCGYGHSCGIHSFDPAHIDELARKTHVGRLLVRQSLCLGNSGNYDNGMPFSMSLGCGSWGRNSVSENIVWKHFLNTTWVSTPISPRLPDEETLFAILREEG